MVLEFCKDTNVIVITNYEQELGKQIYSEELIIKGSSFPNCEILEVNDISISIKLENEDVIFNIPLSNVKAIFQEYNYAFSE